MLYSLGILADEAGADAGAGNGAMTGGMGIVSLLYIAIPLLIFYFMLIRPQKKQRKKQEDLVNSIEPGDNIMTSSGFYGTVLDVVDETTVIVEFGNNKNCRIPMHKRAIAEVEKAGTAEVTDEDSDK